ncbi:MAG TPA: hypothetical protein VFG80_02795, partial [Myxococcota bacterium]|nr:hypothetical protein [Myxococcota bacterium]
MAAPGSPRAHLGEGVRSLALAAASIAFAFAVVEIGARAAGLQPFRPKIGAGQTAQYHVAHPLLGYAPRPGRFEIFFGDGRT